MVKLSHPKKHGPQSVGKREQAKGLILDLSGTKGKGIRQLELHCLTTGHRRRGCQQKRRRGRKVSPSWSPHILPTWRMFTGSGHAGFPTFL